MGVEELNKFKQMERDVENENHVLASKVFVSDFQSCRISGTNAYLQFCMYMSL
jgi:hypothetical protein